MKINFGNRKTDLFATASFARQNNLDHASVLEQAMEQNVLINAHENFR